jgi:ABC-type polysaccharide/polyol phosphate export permease
LQVIEKNASFNNLTGAPRIPGTFFLQNLVERRSLLVQLVRRDFEQRFVGSAMGWIWGLIHPLVLLLSWTFVFQSCLKQSVPEGEDTSNYPLWLFAGMLPWLLFSETVQRSASSILEQANLITKTVFPAEMIPVSVFLSSLASHLLGVALMVGAAAVFLNQISIYLLLLPVYMVVVGLLSIGIGWIVASLHVFLRDTAQVVSVVLLLWFWMTPIFIAPQVFPRWAHFLLVANPFYYVVRAYRRLLLGSTAPSLGDLAIVTASALAAFILGGLFFRHMKRGFADVL